ncbi:MAG: c-type cytochrome [Flavobacteriaceae bacterium]|nr:c-type cytochrome [Flavobacteriaceae bacterium]
MNRLLSIIFFTMISCNSQSGDSSLKSTMISDKGIGPVNKVVLDKDIDPGLAKSGEKLFNQLCTSCHMINKESIGPAIEGILNRRSTEWVMNMILNPTEMLEKDPQAKKLLKEYNNVYMYNQHLIEEEVREIIEYFRTIN